MSLIHRAMGRPRRGSYWTFVDDGATHLEAPGMSRARSLVSGRRRVVPETSFGPSPGIPRGRHPCRRCLRMALVVARIPVHRGRAVSPLRIKLVGRETSRATAARRDQRTDGRRKTTTSANLALSMSQESSAPGPAARSRPSTVWPRVIVRNSPSPAWWTLSPARQRCEDVVPIAGPGPESCSLLGAGSGAARPSLPDVVCYAVGVRRRPRLRASWSTPADDAGRYPRLARIADGAYPGHARGVTPRPAVDAAFRPSIAGGSWGSCSTELRKSRTSLATHLLHRLSTRTVGTPTMRVFNRHVSKRHLTVLTGDCC